MTDTITLPRSVVEQALKLLDALSYDENYDYDGCFQHWTDYARPEKLALQFRAALEQPQTYPLPDDLYDSKDWRAGSYADRVEWLHVMYESAKEQIAALEQPQVEQEPVAEVIESHVRAGLDGRFTAVLASRERLSVGAELYVHPQPPRLPLTDEQIYDCLNQARTGLFLEFARAIERAHGIGGKQ